MIQGCTMIVSEDVLTAFASYLEERGRAVNTINNYVAQLRKATREIGETWTSTTDFSGFIEGGDTASTQQVRRHALNKFIQWAAMKGEELSAISREVVTGGDQEESQETKFDLEALTVRIAQTPMPDDVQSILLLIVEGGLLVSDILGLDIQDVQMQPGKEVLLLGHNHRPYPLTEAHTPHTLRALRMWYETRMQADPLSDAPLFITRQQGRREISSLKRWWDMVVDHARPTRMEAQQARVRALRERYPHVADALLGYTGAPRLSAEELRKALA